MGQNEEALVPVSETEGINNLLTQGGNIDSGQVTGPVNAEAWTQAESTVTAATQISSFAELKELAPKLYQMIVYAWGMEIWRQGKHFAQHIHDIYQEARRQK